jgi:hypothetical protein
MILEEALLMSSTSTDTTDIVDGSGVRVGRWRDIATAIYLDDQQTLKTFVTNGIYNCIYYKKGLVHMD